MLKLDNNLLQELGLGTLPEDQKKSMLQHIYDTLELRVGTQLANQMTDQQLAEFEQFIDAGGDSSQAQALQWLETNLPNYKQVVNDVFEALKNEVKQMASQIVAAASQPAAVQPPAQNPDAYQQLQQPVQTPQYQQPYQAPQAPQLPVYQAQPNPQQYEQSMPPQAPQQAPISPQFPTQQPPAGPAPTA